MGAIWSSKRQLVVIFTRREAALVLCFLQLNRLQRCNNISEAQMKHFFFTVAVYWGVCLKSSWRCLYFCRREMYQGMRNGIQIRSISWNNAVQVAAMFSPMFWMDQKGSESLPHWLEQGASLWENIKDFLHGVLLHSPTQPDPPPSVFPNLTSLVFIVDHFLGGLVLEYFFGLFTFRCGCAFKLFSHCCVWTTGSTPHTPQWRF